MIKQLSKERTRKLEKITTPPVNIVSLTDQGLDDLKHRGVNVVWGFTTWYATWELDANKFREQRDKLIELFGVKPNYHVDYEYKNAVWGFEIDGNEVVVYTSIKGTSVQVENRPMTCEELVAIMSPLVDKMINWDFLNSGSHKAETVKHFLGA